MRYDLRTRGVSDITESPLFALLRLPSSYLPSTSGNSLHIRRETLLEVSRTEEKWLSRRERYNGRERSPVTVDRYFNEMNVLRRRSIGIPPAVGRERKHNSPDRNVTQSRKVTKTTLSRTANADGGPLKVNLMKEEEARQVPCARCRRARACEVSKVARRSTGGLGII